MSENQKTIGLRTVFMGTATFAEKILSALISADYNIIGVYTQKDKKVGRKQEVEEGAVKAIAEQNQIPVFQPAKFDDEAIEELRKMKPDLIIVAAYGKILPKETLKLPGFGAINIHPSLLPKFRGPSPIQNALLEGESETGTTIMLMDEGMDTGDVLAQQKVIVSDHETYPELLEKLAASSTQLLLETVPLWIERKIEPTKQDNLQATLCQLIERQDGQIIWSDEAQNIYNRYRALTPWPGVYTFWERNRYNFRLKLNKLNVIRQNPETTHTVGEVFEIGDNVGVQTDLGVIILEEVQLEGKNNAPIKEFLNGYPDFLGTVLK